LDHVFAGRKPSKGKGNEKKFIELLADEQGKKKKEEEGAPFEKEEKLIRGGGRTSLISLLNKI